MGRALAGADPQDDGQRADVAVTGPRTVPAPRGAAASGRAAASRSTAALYIALALAAAGLSACTTGRPAPASGDPGPSLVEVLPNGTRVIVEEHRAADVVALQLWVRAGARDEAPHELGVAHYLEHLLFRGTTTRPPGFVDREVERVGGRMNASTSWDYTAYRLLLPAARAGAGVELLADIAVNATLDEAHLERERRVVLEEMRLAEESPWSVLTRRLRAAVFADHPYGRPILGTPTHLAALARDQVLAFYRRHYGPEAFTLVIVGAVDPQATVELARRAFGRLPRGAGRLPAPPPPAPRAHREEVGRPGGFAYLGLAWLAPRLDHADTPAVDLLVGILGQGRAARLVRALRDQLGLASAVTASYAAHEAAGLVTIAAQVEPGHVARAEQALEAELRRLQADGVRPAELRRALALAEARRAFQAETAEGRAATLGHADTVWRLEDERAYLDRLRAVTLAQVAAAARRYLDPAQAARVVLRPRATP